MGSPFKPPARPRFETPLDKYEWQPAAASIATATMADRPNTPVPTMAEIENPIEDAQSSGEQAVDLEAIEEQAVALAASKLTRPTTRLANDVLLLIATRGTAKDLGKAQVVSRGWQAAARREVTLRTTGRVLNVFSEKPAYLRSIPLSSTSTLSTQHLLDGVAMSVPHCSTGPARPRRRPCAGRRGAGSLGDARAGGRCRGRGSRRIGGLLVLPLTL